MSKKPDDQRPAKDKYPQQDLFKPWHFEFLHLLEDIATPRALAAEPDKTLRMYMVELIALVPPPKEDKP